MYIQGVLCSYCGQHVWGLLKVSLPQLQVCPSVVCASSWYCTPTMYVLALLRTIGVAFDIWMIDTW